MGAHIQDSRHGGDVETEQPSANTGERTHDILGVRLGEYP